jgi:hypothetical protein
MLICCGLLTAGHLQAQVRVKGTVFDSSRRHVIEAVSVMTTAGKGTITDSLGRYQLEVGEKDSIWFSFLGRPTPKYPVQKILDPSQFDIAIHLKADVLPTVKIRSRNYKEDSVQNRKDYAKVFDYRKPTIAPSITSGGVGFDLQQLIRVFQFRKNKSMERFKQRLMEQEKEKFVDHRFNKGLVRRLTGLEGDALTSFMNKYRPTYEFTAITRDYEFQLYIKKAFEEFRQTAKTF